MKLLVAPANFRLAITSFSNRWYALVWSGMAIDTLMLVGSIGSHFKGVSQNLFILGAISASFIWFFSLAYGSRVLILLFRKTLTWRMLDIFTAFVMFYVSYKFFLET